jgi:hypothetical protein
MVTHAGALKPSGRHKQALPLAALEKNKPPGQSEQRNNFDSSVK